MSRWYRAYEGTVSDGKLAESALVVGCSRSVAVATWHAILENAASLNSGGEFDIPSRRIAAMLCEPFDVIESLFAAFEAIGLIADSTVSSWKKRQYEWDNSTERSRRHRERARNGDATLQQRCATPPETETDTEDTLCRVSPSLSPPRRKAVRLSADWRLPPEWHDWAGTEFPHWPDGMIEREAAQMRDWSLSSPKGAKLDWFATWRGWCRREDGKRPHERNHRSTPTSGQQPTGLDAIAAACTRIIDRVDGRHTADGGG